MPVLALVVAMFCFALLGGTLRQEHAARAAIIAAQVILAVLIGIAVVEAYHQAELEQRVRRMFETPAEPRWP